MTQDNGRPHLSLPKSAAFDGLAGGQHRSWRICRVYDCTTYLHYEEGTGRPYSVVSGRADYDAGHIPGSAFLDLQGDLSVGDSPFRFTMPALDDLAQRFAVPTALAMTRSVCPLQPRQHAVGDADLVDAARRRFR